MAALLPECDRSAESAGNSYAGVSSDLFKSAAFQSAMSNFQNLLASGMFDREGPNVGGSKVVDHFRRLHTETNLSASNWRETMPLVGKKRRAAKKLAAEAAPLRRLCDVHLKPLGGVAPTASHASRSQAESVAAACQSLEFS
uniref:Uncharacterized protein n=1 Tax=Tetraselmis chuii TaxID=63592 RepID=A0A7S1SHL6_9CHLO